jgi:ABC-type multidrug transport system fused ATPase/permease subunit
MDHAKLSHYPNYALVAVNFATQQVQGIQQVEAPEDLFKYISVYVGLSLAAAIMATIQVLFFRVAAMRSSQALFKTLLSAVLAAPLRWVDTVPLGRVLNRFTSDIYTVDNVIGTHISELALSTLQICGVLITSVSVSPIILVFAAILLAASLRLATIYLAAAREVKRLESVSRSPILEQFTSSLTGLTTIRAFDQTRKYVQAMFTRIDGYSKVSRNLLLFNWWLQLRISLLGAIFATFTAILVVRLGVSASLAGFALSFVLQYNQAVSTMIRVYANFEMDMNATERVIDYASIETEPQDGVNPPAAWPTQGRMVVDDLVVRYSPELPPVLKGLTFTVESNERIGVVGRTGSGKSTLALALFRFMEASQGRVLIDGLDTSQVKLHALRKNLAIVPQHPTLFAGTIKSNLDPFDWYSQTELIDALERVHLISPDKKSNSVSLGMVVSEGGANFSQGQRQLLCLARAILQQPKIMILDEATSAVDKETDEHIQKAIRSEFGRNMSSLLVIAHRLSTVADFERILVLDEGEIVEFGSPRDLIKIKGGAFQDLVNQSDETALLKKLLE